MVLSWCGCQIGTTSLIPWVLNCGGGAENGKRTGKFCLEIGLGGFQVCYASAIGAGCGRVHAYRGMSLVNWCTGSTPGSTSSRAVEKAMKGFRAAEKCWSAEPKCKQLLCTTLSKNAEVDTVEGARGSLQIVGARVNELRCKDASVSDGHEQQVLDVGNQSSHPLACRREILMDGVTSYSESNDSVAESFSSTRIAGGNWCSSDCTCDSLEVVSDVTRSHDDSHDQDTPVFSSVFSKDGFWAAAEMERLAKRQATQKSVTFHQRRPDSPDMRNQVDDRYFIRCIHHLLAVSSLSLTTTTDKESVYNEQEQTIFTKSWIEMDLKANEDDEQSSVMSGASGSHDIYYQKQSTHLWGGYWAGPDYEDGWGVVAALVSPVDMGEPVCSTTE